MTMQIHKAVNPFARLELAPLASPAPGFIRFATRLFSSWTPLDFRQCRVLPGLSNHTFSSRQLGLRGLTTLAGTDGSTRMDGPIETASSNVRAGVALRAKISTEQDKDRIRFTSKERKIEVFRSIEAQLGQSHDMYLAMKDNYDHYVRRMLPDLVSLDGDINEKCSDNMESFFERGLDVCHEQGRLLHVSGVRELSPSDFAIVIGLGIKQRYLDAIDKSGASQPFKDQCRALALRLCEFEIGVLCCDVRTMNATGMLGNRIFRKDDGLEPELYARQILNTIYVSHLMQKYSGSYAQLFYHFGSEARFLDRVGSAWRITDLSEDKRSLLLGEIENSGRDKKSFTADHIVYASLHQPNTEDFRWVNCYSGEFLLEILNPQKGILTDGIGPSRTLETGFSMDTQFEILSVDHTMVGNMDGTLKYHARLMAREA